jgi:hypothetical protein
MSEPETGSAREEAERLVAAALAAASVAARGLVRSANPLSGVADAAERLLAGGGPGHVATGSPECCVCPLCRAIAAVRDPSPQVALKLATGAADLASNVTGVLRTVGDLVSGPPAQRPATPAEPAPGGVRRPATPAEPATERPRKAADPDITWRMATAAGGAAAGNSGTPQAAPGAGQEPDDPWHAATTAGN